MFWAAFRSFYHRVSLSLPCRSFLMWDFAFLLLKIFIQLFFFSFLFLFFFLVIFVLIILVYYYYYYYYLLIESFSHQRKLMVFHWRLSDSKSLQVSRNLLSILTVFNNAVVLIVSTRPPTFKSSSPSSNPLVTVPKAPITIGMIYLFIYYYYYLLIRVFLISVSW